MPAATRRRCGTRVEDAGYPGPALTVSSRQLKDPRVVSFSPMRHWTEHNIRVHVFTCVLALPDRQEHAINLKIVGNSG